MVLSLRFKLSISELSCDVRGDCRCFSDALRDGRAELADVPAVWCELSRLGVEEDSEVSKRNKVSFLEARCASAEVVTSVA